MAIPFLPKIVWPGRKIQPDNRATKTSEPDQQAIRRQYQIALDIVPAADREDVVRAFQSSDTAIKTLEEQTKQQVDDLLNIPTQFGDFPHR